MAGVQCYVTSGEIALTAATPKSVLRLVAAAQQRVLVNFLSIMGKSAAGGGDTPMKVRLTRTTAASGAVNALTPGKNDPGDGETLQTGAGTCTSEPTSPTDNGLWFEINPQTGLILQFPPGQEIKIPGGQAWYVECTAPANATVTVTAGYQE